MLGQTVCGPEEELDPPPAHLGLLLPLRPALAKARSRLASPSDTRICGDKRGASPGPPSDRYADAGAGAQAFCFPSTTHPCRGRTAVILPHRSCQRWGGGWPSPRLPISQVPLSGLCLSLRVPVAAWTWTEAQRVTKRGSPCAASLRRLLDCVRAIFEAIADDLMNHSTHIWLRRGTVLPHAAVESGVSQNESAAAEPQARGKRVRVSVTHFQSIGVQPPGSESRGRRDPTLWFPQ